MVDLVVVGSLALDSVKTPFGEVESVLGGSASYASYAASFFCRPGLVGVVGNDFPKQHVEMLSSREIDVSGIEVAEGKTFRWKGSYEFDLNVAHTHLTELGVFESFKPKIPEAYRNADYLFLGNISPQLQLDVLGQMKKRPKLVVADTMNFWIEGEREKVLEVVKKADIILLNDGEARQLFKTHNLVRAAREILKLDSEFAIIKKGEHGSVLFTDKTHFSAPGYPLEDVVDPTGAGDCFAGSLIGYLSQTGDLSEENFRKAIVHASAVASFNAEGFSLNNLQKISMKEIEQRVSEFRKIVEF